jgi:chromosome partitioning protein
MALQALELQMVSMFSREKVLRRKLEEIRAHYDLIFLDCSPSVNMLTINALTAADSVLVPVQASSFYALYGMSQLMNTIRYVQSDPNPDLKVLGVILTMSNNTKIAKEVSSQLRENFGDKLFNSVIRLNTKLAEAPAMGQTINTYAGDSPVAEDYRNLAEEIKVRAKI